MNGWVVEENENQPSWVHANDSSQSSWEYANDNPQQAWNPLGFATYLDINWEDYYNLDWNDAKQSGNHHFWEDLG
jgi:hypothetical protein